MRSPEEVMAKFVEVRDAKLKERRHDYLCRLPINCSYNIRMKVKGRGQVGFCMNQEVCSKSQNGLFVCNDEETARRCCMFVCKNTDESVERDFMEILRVPSRCGDVYPKLAVMI